MPLCLIYSQSPIPDLIITGDQTFAYLGNSVASAGDINGDGYDDIIVGAWQYDHGENGEGRAYVHLGSALGVNSIPASTMEGDQVTAYYGYSVACAGDVNGDGYDDIIVGAHQYSNGQTNEGRAYIYHGSATGINIVPAAILEINQSHAQFGCSVSTAGDVNGDGFDDIIVGAKFYDNGQLDEGRAYIFHGSITGIITTPAVSLEGNDNGSFFGISVSNAGDINNDGYGDVIVGASYFDDGIVVGGKVFVYHGSAIGINAIATLTLDCGQASAYFGSSATSAGDINGDGFDDVIIGANQYTNGQNYEGRVFIYYGSVSGLNPSPILTMESNQVSAFYGTSSASAGDVNNDGYGDILVGAYQYSNGENNEGRAYLYLGSAAGLNTTAELIMECNQTFSYLGTSVTCAGDVNNDGNDDIIIGASSYEEGFNNEGGAFIYLSDYCVAIAEVCNGVDDNCNGLIDDGVTETINISSDGPTIFCQGGSVLLTAIYSGTSLQWKRNGVNIAGATSPSYNATKSGTYTCETSSICDSEISNSIIVTVNKNPPASITAGGATTFCTGGSVLLTANTGGGLSYQWFRGATLITGATSLNYTATVAGNYKCRVTKTATGCFKNSNTISVTVPCKEGEFIDIENEFSVYPNPNNGTFMIDLNYLSNSGNIDANIEIYNAIGQIIYSNQLTDAITLKDITAGIYVVKLQIGNNTLEQKMIIQN